LVSWHIAGSRIRSCVSPDPNTHCELQAAQGGFFFFTIPAARLVGRPGEFDPQWLIREPDDFVSILPLWPDRFEQILWDFIPELSGNSVSSRLTAAHNE
jgi:hypothetical protein